MEPERDPGILDYLEFDEDIDGTQLLIPLLKLDYAEYLLLTHDKQESRRSNGFRRYMSFKYSILDYVIPPNDGLRDKLKKREVYAPFVYGRGIIREWKNGKHSKIRNNPRY